MIRDNKIPSLSKIYNYCNNIDDLDCNNQLYLKVLRLSDQEVRIDRQRLVLEIVIINGE